MSWKELILCIASMTFTLAFIVVMEINNRRRP